MAVNKKLKKRDGIYTRKDRAGYWISYLDAQGRRHMIPTNAPTLEQARMIRNAKLLEVERQKVLGYATPTEETFEKFAAEYLKHKKKDLTTKSWDRSRGIVEKHLCRSFGTARLADIRRREVERYVAKRSGEVGAESVAKELNVLKNMLNVAVQQEKIPVNYALGVLPPKPPAGRVKYLQASEVELLLTKCQKWLQPMVLLLLATGMRRSELLRLRWLDVDRKGNRILLPQTKNGEGRIVWLNTMACRVIDSLPRKGTYVFPEKDYTSPENVSLAFLRACRRARIEDFHLHDLRHTCASWMRMQGADIHIVAVQLGHKDLRMAMRYQHLAPDYLHKAVCGLDGVFAPALAGAQLNVSALTAGQEVSEASA